MTYREAYELLEDYVRTRGYAPLEVYQALDGIEDLVEEVRLVLETGIAVQEAQTAHECGEKPPELQSGVAIQTYHMVAIPLDPDIDARVEEMARKAKEPD